MAVISVPVSQLKAGDQIGENVLTKKGNLLFEKGRFVTPREVEILRAFFIAFVSIEGRADAEVKEESSGNQAEEVNELEVPFFDKYEQLLKLLRKVFFDARNGQTPPVLEIRTQLENVLQYIDQ